MNPGIYLHMPICKSRCIYCDFYSQTDVSVENSLVNALVSEMGLIQKRHPDFKAVTIYLGGGTPSCFKIESLNLIINQCRKLFNAAGEIIEITIEANPDDIDDNLARGFHEIGINRVSLGTQSFIDSELDFLGRRHNSSRNDKAINSLRKAGFNNFSLDLIFALPGQSRENFKKSIEAVIDAAPAHISLYCLTYESGTRLYTLLNSGKISTLDDREQAYMIRMAIDKLRQAGYLQYEISNFARPGFECLHNMNYWTMGDYLGFGPSAHSHINFRRWANHADIQKYTESLDSAKLPRSFEEILSRERITEEYLMLSLRLREGIDLDRYKKLAGRDLLTYKENMIRALLKKGLIELHGKFLRLTLDGILVADEITANLI